MTKAVSKASHALRAHLRTIYSPTPSFLSQHLEKHSPGTKSASLYLLSNSLPTSTLQPLLSVLQQLPSSIGSCSAQPPDSEPFVSIATFEDAVKVFHTDLSGRGPAEVGRWQRPTKEVKSEDLKGSQIGESEAVRSTQGWEGMWNAEEGPGMMPELQDVQAESFIVLSDGSPRPVLRSLRSMYPQSSILGLLTQPTPFLTGRPHTLIHNNKIYSSGSLGLALGSGTSLDIDYSVKAISHQYQVSQAQGNLLLEMQGEGNGNPAQTLISAVQRSTTEQISKEEEFYLALIDSKTGKQENVVRILSGGPSKGTLSLDTDESLEGRIVQFMGRGETSEDHMLPRSGVMSFATLQRHEMRDDTSRQGESRIEDGFIGLSEQGFIHNSNICNVPQALVRLHTA